MRPTPAIAIVVSVAAEYGDQLLSPPPPSPTPTPPCNPHSSCKLRQTPDKISKDFEANAAVILIILLCALICALALNAAIRCSLRYNTRRPPSPHPSSEAKPNMAEISYVEPPTLVFVPGMNLEAGAGSGSEAVECAICLSEYLEGERIRVLDVCKHVFHVQCIQQWLFSHSSCPTCRAEASCNATAATAAANSATEYS